MRVRLRLRLRVRLRLGLGLGLGVGVAHVATPFHAAPSARLLRVSGAAPLSHGSAGVSTACRQG